MKIFIKLIVLTIIYCSAFAQSEESNNTSLKTIDSRIDSLIEIRDSLTRKLEGINSEIERLKADREEYLSKDDLSWLAESIKNLIFLTNGLGDRREVFNPPWQFRPDKISIEKNNLGEFELVCTMVDSIAAPDFWEKRGKNKYYYSFWRFYEAIRLPTKTDIMRRVFSLYPNISRVRLKYKAAWFDYNEYGQREYSKLLNRYEVTVTQELSDKINYRYFEGTYETPDNNPTRSDFKKFYNTLKSTFESVWFEKRVRTDLHSVGINL